MCSWHSSVWYPFMVPALESCLFTALLDSCLLNGSCLLIGSGLLGSGADPLKEFCQPCTLAGPLATSLLAPLPPSWPHLPVEAICLICISTSLCPNPPPPPSPWSWLAPQQSSSSWLLQHPWSSCQQSRPLSYLCICLLDCCLDIMLVLDNCFCTIILLLESILSILDLESCLAKAALESCLGMVGLDSCLGRPGLESCLVIIWDLESCRLQHIQMWTTCCGIVLWLSFDAAWVNLMGAQAVSPE